MDYWGNNNDLDMPNYTFKICLIKTDISLIKEEKNEGKGNSLRKTLCFIYLGLV